jgi:transposase-like protein
MDMKPSRFTEEQIIWISAGAGGRAKTAEVCRKHGVSCATFYKWKLIGTLRQHYRRSRAQGPFAPASTTHLQSFLAIEPAQLFVLHDDAFAPEQDMQPPIAEPSANALTAASSGRVLR